MALQAAEKVGLANLSVRLTNLEVARSPTLCHPDRSEAEWRDLRCAFPRSNSDEVQTPSATIFAGHGRSPDRDLGLLA
jgi:hypothetical protein